MEIQDLGKICFDIRWYLFIQCSLFECLSEGVPREVFGPWVRWEGGQVIPDLSRRRAQKMTKKYFSQKYPKSMSLDSGHLD